MQHRHRGCVAPPKGRSCDGCLVPGTLAVNGAPVGSIGEFRKAVDSSGATVALLIQRDNAQIFVPVRIDS